VHPAFSVIFFTTASGAGYGMLAILGVMAPFGLLPSDRLFAVVAMALALGAVAAGLLASTAHLGHPERAWRALSQWRSSWLSREGLAALATFVPAGLFAVVWIFSGAGDGLSSMFGLLTAIGAIATVFCTAMIYCSLKPIQRWANGWVVPNYLALGLMTGTLWLTALTALFGYFFSIFFFFSPVFLLAPPVVLVAAALKLAYWRFIDTTRSLSTAESATGLGPLGKVRLFEAPHTEENYLLKEMGYQVARKHRPKLRRIAVYLCFLLPFLLSLAPWILGQGGTTVAACLAAVSASIGVLFERWLFFAEAKHAVTLYYGAARA
jgi:sulfite dehydrogenase (quinone) subunit SoeC